MGRKRVNHQIYTSAEERWYWSVHVAPVLIKLRAEFVDCRISEPMVVVRALEALLNEIGIEPVGPRPCQVPVSFLHRRWRGIPDRALLALERWIEGRWNLVLAWRMLTPLEVLELVAQGRRCVSVVPEDIETLIEDKFDALGFIVHDLMHAYQLFHDEASCVGQQAFARSILEWREQLPADEEFFAHPEFLYLISDMNSHPVHLRQTLESLCARLQRPQYWRAFVASMTDFVAPSEMITNVSLADALALPN